MNNKILLYVCCAPDATYPVETLRETGYEVTAFFYNPNVQPVLEYGRRAAAMCLLAHDMELTSILGEYDDDKWTEALKGRADDIEGGESCFKCFEFRLERAAQETKKFNIPVFTSTLTISPHKNSLRINDLGRAIAEKYGISYLESDFKKKDGFKKSVELSRKYGIYRQNYCGCSWSLNERKKNTPEL